MRETTEKRAIALCNLPLWMAIMNVYPVGFGVNSFFTDVRPKTGFASIQNVFDISISFSYIWAFLPECNFALLVSRRRI